MGERLMPSLRAGTMKHNAMKLLADCEGKTVKELYNSLAIPELIKFSVFSKQIETLVEYGVLTSNNGQVALTIDGHGELNKLNASMKKKEGITRANLFTRSVSDVYDGAELKRHCHRPGAYDAYDKPSLINRTKE